MAYTFYDSSIGTSKAILASLDNLITIASKQPNASDLPAAKLHSDMRPLSSQVHLATQAVDRMLARINGVEFVAPEDDLATFEDMHARIASRVAKLDAMDRETVNKRGEVTEATTLTPEWTTDMPVSGFVAGASIPNIYFHLNMAYAILRNQGVPLGKLDYIMAFMTPQLPKAA